LETELKFELDSAGAKALGEHLMLASMGQRHTLRAVYYDTPETDLRDHGLSLRVRDDGKRRIQTIKRSAPGGNGFRREEWESALAADAGDLSPDLDAAALTPLGEVLNRRELAFVRPVFEVEISRITRSLEVGGAIIEIALDRGRARADGRDAPINELELELKVGEPRALFNLARELLGVAPLELCFTSKAARGYALLEDAPPTAMPASDPPLGRDDTAGQAFQVIAGAALTQMAANAEVLRATRSPEAVHQLRVGVRRLRSAISVFAPMLADDGFGKVKAELKWLAAEMDEARDLDVFILETYQPALAREPDSVGLAGLGERLAAARGVAYARADAAVRAERFRTLMLEALAWIEAGDWSLGDDPMLTVLRTRPVVVLAAEQLDALRRTAVKKSRDLAAMSPSARHRLRIKVKRLRYACGFFSSLARGKPARIGELLTAFTTAARDLQDNLGALSDMAVSEALVARVAGLDGEPAGDRRPDPKAVFAAGVLIGESAARAATLLKAAIKAHRALRKAEVFW
jgi:inorganic triphosphatase YgiF